ncbi:folylpolyglutamate synthase/dihydrofolate synthase family protein [Microvirga rosea]|uniref:hypothetical protein n=1 Tax=Microvirga rosea TaxID=2715425 RepID=UPI001D0A2A16|nr:hypothetical protein [Microvirga rosea]MCB8823440.1 hypothetical protein [Microvirga rosea]
MPAARHQDPGPNLKATLGRLDHLTNWESRPRGSMRVRLEPMLDLLKRLGNPHHAFRSVHVSGTKGKGSVCALVDAGLRRAGWRVGRYTSPHVEHVTERICLLGKPVREDVLAAALAKVLNVYEEAKALTSPARDATWFDILTAAAFVVFKDADVEIAVVEVGLGGPARLDQCGEVNRCGRYQCGT